METLEFTTPTTRTRDADPIAVDFCGEEFVVNRPKDWVLLSAQTVLAENITDAERALAIIQFLLGTLGEQGYSRFVERTLDRDDPVTLDTTTDLVAQLLQTWGDYRPGTRVTVEAQPVAIHGEPVRVVHDELGLDVEAHPPKDITVMIFAATASSPEEWGQQWAAEYFLDAVLSRADAMVIKRRLRSGNNNDVLDVEHLDPILESLLHRWSGTTGAANREQRRAATKTRSKTKTSETKQR